ncbi:MotA/TolQ/ExbB proton channel family protein [Aquisphaera insulae]|uniref:MotA/TolQ/ExbB proton channel family protein n=1 Tax=Aquisphaera insulae TaxID=2712864 RepID=UPI00202FCFE0|nr:MotA/TolQ/ExbB proton channel family protein [Aquisphaera insulae]
MRSQAASNRCLRMVAVLAGLLASAAVGAAARADEADTPRAASELLDTSALTRLAARTFIDAATWYRRTPPGERMTWGGLAAAAVLGVWVLAEGLFRLRRRRVIPADFAARFLDRLHEGKLDGGKALDYCEMNPSPAARVALAAVRRWGRPAADLERAVVIAHRVEADRLRRNVGTLRRIAALAPLLGLLGSLMAIGRVLASRPIDGSSGSLGTALASALTPLTLGVAVATLALVAYDALVGRIERLAGALDRLGAETIDAIAMAKPAVSPLLTVEPSGTRSFGAHSGHAGPSPGAHPPHQAPAERRRPAEPSRRPGADHEIGF